MTAQESKRRRTGSERKESLPTVHSSATMNSRALLMLGCLIAAPLLAVFCDSQPGSNGGASDPVRESQSPATEWRPGVAQSPPNIRPFQPSAKPILTRPAPRATPIVRAMAHDETREADDSFRRRERIPSHVPPVAAALGNLDSADGRGSVGPAPDSRRNPNRLVPVGGQGGGEVYPARVRSRLAEWPPDTAGNFRGEPEVAAPTADLFTRIRQRLRQAGVTYCRLETWGNEGNLYRFHCRLSLPGDPSAVRHFEATDADAIEAMKRVLGQVEAWQAER